MSPSPATANATPGTTFNRGQADLGAQLWQGASWSGNERNCAFLNTGAAGTPRFANISAVSGFDFKDDARAIGLADHDGDGDLDAWVTARYPVQFRCLESSATDLPKSGDWIQLHIQGNGTTVNRDAIGTRVTLHLVNDPRSITRTVRAGGAFLSQSSKTLHFGLGRDSEIGRAEVIWPDGTKQTLTDIPKNSFLTLTRDDLTKRKRSAPVGPPPARPLQHTALRNLFVVPSPAPEISYTTLSGTPKVFSPGKKPTLVLLWATWCTECLTELAALEAVDTSILALCVDGLGDDRSADAATIRTTAARFIRPHITIARATPATLKNLQTFVDATSLIRRDLAIPDGFLIDTRGNLSATYRGAVPASQLASDLAIVDAPPAERLPYAVPFPGRWADKTITTNTDQIARTFRNAGDLAHAEKLFAAAAPHWHRNPFFLHDQALVLQQLNRFPESLPILERALPETTGRNDIAAAIHNSLGVAHAKTGHPKKALENFKKALALDPANEAAMKNLRALSK